MKAFHEMLRKIASSPDHDQMLRFTVPLKDYLGINHFWYYRITFTGFYSYLGTHTAWNEFCFDHSMTSHFSCVRHPNILPKGIYFMKAGAVGEYKNVLQLAWDKFHINFNINLIDHIPEGIEAFGFATHYNDAKVEERLINHLPMLRYFTTVFRNKYKKIFQLLEDNQIHIGTLFGSAFYEHSKVSRQTIARDEFLRKIGCQEIFALSPREKEVLRFVTNGFPASYIAQQLKLKCKTVENYIDTIKDKLSCFSKIELIQKAQQMASIGFLD